MQHPIVISVSPGINAPFNFEKVKKERKRGSGRQNGSVQKKVKWSLFHDYRGSFHLTGYYTTLKEIADSLSVSPTAIYKLKEGLTNYERAWKLCRYRVVPYGQTVPDSESRWNDELCIMNKKVTKPNSIDNLISEGMSYQVTLM